MIQTSDNTVYTVLLTVVYNESSEKFYDNLKELIARKYPLVKLVGYHEDILKERKKAFGVKGSYAARQTPFAVMFDVEDKPIKAFYSEVNECTVDNIEHNLDSIIPY